MELQTIPMRFKPQRMLLSSGSMNRTELSAQVARASFCFPQAPTLSMVRRPRFPTSERRSLYGWVRVRGAHRQYLRAEQHLLQGSNINQLAVNVQAMIKGRGALAAADDFEFASPSEFKINGRVDVEIDCVAR